MKKFYIKTLSIAIFLSLYIAQGAFCADLTIAQNDTNLTVQGVDFKDFKKIKSFFNKKEKTVKTQKEIKLEETELDNSTFSMFEDEDNSMFLDNEKQNQEASLKKSEKKKFNLFNKKNKPLNSHKNELSGI